jgi:hypothetical protein
MAAFSLAFQVFIVVLGVVIAWRWLHRPGGLAAMSRGWEKDAFALSRPLTPGSATCEMPCLLPLSRRS